MTTTPTNDYFGQPIITTAERDAVVDKTVQALLSHYSATREDPTFSQLIQKVNDVYGQQLDELNNLSPEMRAWILREENVRRDVASPVAEQLMLQAQYKSIFG